MFQSLSILLAEMELLTELGAHQFFQTVWMAVSSQGLLVSISTVLEVVDTGCHSWQYMWMLGISTQAFLLGGKYITN